VIVRFVARTFRVAKAMVPLALTCNVANCEPVVMLPEPVNFTVLVPCVKIPVTVQRVPEVPVTVIVLALAVNLVAETVAMLTDAARIGRFDEEVSRNTVAPTPVRWIVSAS